MRWMTGRRTRVAAAGRTDAGVHAWGQIISFKTVAPYSTETFVKALNYYLPGDIAVKVSHRVRDSFNVRHQAVSREYQYHILNSLTRSPLGQGLAHFVGGQLDIAAMNEASQALLGEHDFASFCSGTRDELKSTVRRVYRAEVGRDGQLVVFKMVANAFLPHQVRSTVGALIKIGLGKLSGDEFRSIMAARKPGLAGPTAPACGLYLMQVSYPRPFEEEI